MARYLVTGGAGFIGSHLVERLLRDGHHVRILDNLATGKRENVEAVRPAGPGRLEWMEEDVRDLAACRRAAAGVDYVLHQAALGSVPRSVEQPGETTAVNVLGTVNVFQAAREAKARRVVWASSSSVYGDTPTLPKHEAMPLSPRSPYAAGKLAGEEFARVFAGTMDLPTVSLRYFNVFGPRQDPDSQYAAVIPRFIRALVEGKRPTVFGDGEQSRDFTYVENVVQVNLAACEQGPGKGEAVNVACGERYTLNDLLRSLEKLLGVRANPEHLPTRAGDVRHSQAAIDQAVRLFGFAPTVGFDEGLARTVEYFRRGR
ncbi:MAG TPA: SDR family oxidoreductase [Candidatus Limnocylindrales bacterium]|nr:SDR family oxidoreductase [Candidatus Limnocylindrales bacterium]